MAIAGATVACGPYVRRFVKQFGLASCVHSFSLLFHLEQIPKSPIIDATRPQLAISLRNYGRNSVGNRMSQNGPNDPKAVQRDTLKRRLVVMFDGTGNTRQNMTNVSRMFEAIDDSHPDSYKPIDDSKVKDSPPFQDPNSKKIVQCKTCSQSMMEPAKLDGDDSEVDCRAGCSCHQVVVEPALQPVQLVKYIKGVGTSWKGVIGRLSAQAVGYGLSDKIKEGYIWLCNHYQEGDEVFVFGFSRGAFAARSLVSLLHKCDGVLKKIPNSRTPVDLSFDVDKRGDDKEAIETAYNYYRAYVESPDETNEAKLNNYLAKKKLFYDYPVNWNKSTEHEHAITKLHVKVKMLGVWDTVGALGVPAAGWSIIDDASWSRTQYQFHDEGLSCIVQNAYHALALDEHREAFKPTLWTSRTSKDQEVKQVWFAGSHCNVGGGADLDDNDDPDDLWQYSYVWMQRHAEKHGLRFYWSYESPATRQANSDSRTRRVSLREPEPSLEKFAGGLYNWYKKLTPWWSVTPYIRETDPNLAMLHWSVVERIKVTEADRVEAEKKGTVLPVYKPKSLFGNHKYAEFMATVIPEGRTESIAPDQVDAKDGVLPPKWHIETDDVMTCKQWALEPR